MSNPPPLQREWEQEWLAADFDRLLERTTDWVERAPAWPPFQRARVLVDRLRPRLIELHVTLNRVLVIGFVGGSGTGKSTLINALVGRCVCEAGKTHRPTTRRPVVLCHTDVDPSFLHLDRAAPEIIRLPLPCLEQMILVDCPDPDTQDLHEEQLDNFNLEILRQVLPCCDVMVHTGTAQKYKTQAVAQELLGHAPGRKVAFVQTHAEQDEDIREDWTSHLKSIGFTVPLIFRLDGERALRQQESHEEPPPEFTRFRQHLHEELAHRSRHRIKRANLMDLLSWLLDAIRTECDRGLEPVQSVEEAIEQTHARLFTAIQSRLRDQLQRNRQLWRTRLLRQLNQCWGGGAFAGLLRMLDGGALLVRSFLLMRARTPIQVLLAGGLAAGQVVGAHRRERRAADAWIAGADLGITEAALIQERSVLNGHLRTAELDGLASAVAGPRDDLSAKELAGVARLLYQQVEVALNDAIERRVTHRAGRWVHATMEMVFLALPVYLVSQMGVNFFYERPTLGKPLLGADYFLQAVFWVLLWGLLLRGILMNRLNRGLEQEAAALVTTVSPAAVLDPLHADMAHACRAVRQHVAALGSLEEELNRLQSHLSQVEDLGLGNWHSGNGRARS